MGRDRNIYWLSSSKNENVLSTDGCCFCLSDWNGAVIALMFLALICHLIAFIIAIVAAIRKGHPFPSFTVGGFFCVAGMQ